MHHCPASTTLRTAPASCTTCLAERPWSSCELLCWGLYTLYEMDSLLGGHASLPRLHYLRRAPASCTMSLAGSSWSSCARGELDLLGLVHAAEGWSDWTVLWPCVTQPLAEPALE